MLRFVGLFIAAAAFVAKVSPLGLILAGPTSTEPVPVDFDRDIKPILQKNCFSCHGAEKPRGGLRLDARAHAIAGGDSGPAIVPGKASESLLIKLVAAHEDVRPMPPKGDRLTAAETAMLSRWIDQKAPWTETAAAATTDKSDWWSLKPLTKPALPATDSEWVRNPIDSFVLAKLTKKGLAPSPEADKRTLVRRVYFDLIGLPPSPEEIEAFSSDPDPNAYEKVVDQLLASPRHGERWARHWLDVVHYGDTHGYDKDQPRPNAWPYRDYVIRSFNNDKRYSQFVQEQVAGDILFPNTRDGIVALAFWRPDPGI